MERTRRTTAGALPGLALVVVAAATATGTGLLLPGADLGPPATGAVRALGLLLAGAGAAALWRARRPEPALPVLAAVTGAALLLGVVALATAAFSPADLDLGGSGTSSTTTTTEQPTTTVARPDGPTTTTLPAEPSALARDDGDGLPLGRLLRGALVLAAAGAALALVAQVLGLVPARGAGARPAPPGLFDADAAEAGVEDALAAIRADAPPATAIDQAYATLLEALARAGGARRPPEAPHEHLDRVLGPLGVAPAPTHRLASLFVLARFGGHTVDEGHRATAVADLEAVLSDLRARAAAAPATPDGGRP